MFLVPLFVISNGYAQELDIYKIIPTDDAYVIWDRMDPKDLKNIRDINYGDKNYLKLWYSFNATDSPKQIQTIGFLKFEIPKFIPERILSAELKMLPYYIESSTKNEISLHFVQDDDWDEENITFSNMPSFSNSNISTADMSIDNWSSWDVTEEIQQDAGMFSSFAVLIKDIHISADEQIAYYSKDIRQLDKIPYIEIKYQPISFQETGVEERIANLEETILELKSEDNGGGCLIATATFGSELAPQVQQLRELRDNTILSTESGTAFMTGFNQFYYSFSPYVADFERENPIFKEAVKLVITPMITSLSLLNHADIDSEEKMLVYGISLILLNIGMYAGIPAFGIYVVKTRRTISF